MTGPNGASMAMPLASAGQGACDPSTEYHGKASHTVAKRPHFDLDTVKGRRQFPRARPGKESQTFGVNRE
jgi:hypothetical protein